MSPLPAQRREPIRVKLTLPVTRIAFGFFSIDPLEQMVGAKIADLLEPLMTGPVERRPSESGAAIEVYPLALPDGEGATIPLGQFGELAFANDHGVLALTVPWAMTTWTKPLRGGHSWSASGVGNPVPPADLSDS